MSPAGQWRWQVFAVAGLTATALYLLELSPTVTTAAFAAVGVGAVWSCSAGPRRYAAEPRRAWPLIGLASSWFLVGVVVRTGALEQPFPLQLIADAAAIPGYLLTAVFLVVLLRVRRSIDWT